MTWRSDRVRKIAPTPCHVVTPRKAILRTLRRPGRRRGSGSGGGREPASLASMPFERCQRADGDAELAQLVGAAELRQVDNEASGEHIGADLPQQLDCPFR